MAKIAPFALPTVCRDIPVQLTIRGHTLARVTRGCKQWQAGGCGRVWPLRLPQPSHAEVVAARRAPHWRGHHAQAAQTDSFGRQAGCQLATRAGGGAGPERQLRCAHQMPHVSSRRRPSMCSAIIPARGWQQGWQQLATEAQWFNLNTVAPQSAIESSNALHSRSVVGQNDGGGTCL